MERIKRYECGFFDGEPWKGLSAGAQLFYLCLEARYDGHNNGEIRFQYRSTVGVKGFASTKGVGPAIKELKRKGWIKVELRGGEFTQGNYFTLTFKHDDLVPKK